MANSGDTEWEQVLASARELLAWEQELTGWDIPVSSWSRHSAAEADDKISADELSAKTSNTPDPRKDQVMAASPGAQTLGSPDSLKTEPCPLCGLSRPAEASKPLPTETGVRVAFVGEGASFDAAAEGAEPFVGEAGSLLGKMAKAMGLEADDIYVCGLAQCRALPDQASSESSEEQCGCATRSALAKRAPRIIVAFGRGVTEHLGCMGSESRRWRGVWASWQGIPVMPTYQPALLIETPKFKRPVWEDLQEVMKRLVVEEGS